MTNMKDAGQRFKSTCTVLGISKSFNDIINMDNLPPITDYQIKESMPGWKRGGSGAKKQPQSTISTLLWQTSGARYL
jgi:hypothetical protein